jgi:hypothetical protein
MDRQSTISKNPGQGGPSAANPTWPDPPLPSEASFFLDMPRLTSPGPRVIGSPLIVAGWLIPPTGRILQSIDISVDGDVVAHARLRLPRPDVQEAFPDQQGALESGFDAAVSLEHWEGRSVELALGVRWDHGHEILARVPLIVRGRDVGQEDRRVSELWAEQSERGRSDCSCWANNHIITSTIYRMMTGHERHWLAWLFEDYFSDVELFGNILSICCGDGAHELEILRSGKAGFLRGFDLSEGAIRRAIERFRGAGIPEDKYLLEVKDANDLEIAGTFDLVLSAGAIHHVMNLEDLLGKIAGMLAPDGRFALAEFVGPARFQ